MKARLLILLLLVSVGCGVGVALNLNGKGSASVGIEVRNGPSVSTLVTAVPISLGHNAVTAVSMGANGSLVLGTEQGLLRYFAPTDVRLRNGLDFGWHIPSRVEGLAVSGDGSTVAAGSDNGGASAWSIRDGEVRGIGVVPYESHARLALNDNGTLLAVLSAESISVYDLRDARRVAALHVALPLPLSGSPQHGEVQQAYSFGFNAASTGLVLVGLSGAEAWSLTTKHRIWSLRCDCGAGDVALSDNARYAVFGTTGGQAILLDLRDRHQIGEVAVTTAHGDETDAVQTDDRGRTLLAASNDELSIWLSSNQLTPPSIQHLTSERIESLAITADGDRVLVGTEPRHIKYEAPGLGANWESRVGPTWLVRLATMR